jgi:hypothetical protein
MHNERLHDLYSSIRDLDQAVVRHMTVLVIKIVLKNELPLIRHNLLYEPNIYIAHILTIDITCNNM